MEEAVVIRLSTPFVCGNCNAFIKQIIVYHEEQKLYSEILCPFCYSVKKAWLHNLLKSYHPIEISFNHIDEPSTSLWEADENTLLKSLIHLPKDSFMAKSIKKILVYKWRRE